MTSARAAATSVLERFLGDSHVIVQLYQDNDDFRELCDHFAECHEVLSRLRDSTKADPARVKEYETLTTELEQEIRAAIDAVR